MNRLHEIAGQVEGIAGAGPIVDDLRTLADALDPFLAAGRTMRRFSPKQPVYARDVAGVLTVAEFRALEAVLVPPAEEDLDNGEA